MEVQKHRKQKNMAQQMKGILGILLGVLLLYMAGSALLLARVKEQAVQEMSEMSQLYTSELDNRFFRISRSIFSLIMEKDQLDSVFWNYANIISDSKNSIEVDYAVRKLREMSASYAWEYGIEYQFFLYFEEDGQYYKLTQTSDGAYDSDKYLEETVLNQIKDIQDRPYSVKKKWSSMAYGRKNYICKIAQNHGVYLGCYVNVQSILEPFSNIIKEDGYVRLVNEEEGISEQYSIQKDLHQAPFSIQIHISGQRMMDVMMASYIFLLALAALLVLAGAAILVYLKKKLLLPVMDFTRKLEQYDEGDFTYAITEGNLLELEQIDGKFRNMIHQVRRLKITIYEQELEKQKIEMDYLKLQIRPHFYLNCLNFINSMIDFGQYQTAVKMTRTTSDYLQYIFRNTNDVVPMDAEIKHCRNYLDILLLRYPEKFEYYFEVNEEVEDTQIFPFLVQVFVENAAKHALELEQKILISVTAYPESRKDGEYVNIYISDTGRGFPAKILEQLQQGKGIAEHGRHLGIENCLKRFGYYYKGQGEINFENSPLCGAVVDIHIPCRRIKAEEEIYESAIN